MNLCSLAIRLKNLDKYSYRPMEISFSKLFSRCYLISLSSHDFNIEILQRMILQRNFEPKPSSTISFKWAISANLVRTETWWFIRHKKSNRIRGLCQVVGAKSVFLIHVWCSSNFVIKGSQNSWSRTPKFELLLAVFPGCSCSVAEIITVSNMEQRHPTPTPPPTLTSLFVHPKTLLLTNVFSRE